jgi:glycosyltransferase involved in cell wall biosynthesis
MANQPTFSVIMPAHNSAATISAAIRSALAQTRGDFELIVIDDGSTDDTLATIRQISDPRLRLVRQEHRGVAAARNRGIETASGLFLSMLDSDDLWMPNYLDVMGRTLEGDPEAGLAYTDAWVFDHQTRRVSRWTAMTPSSPPLPPPADPSALLDRLMRANFVYTAVTMRRSVVDQAGLFEPSLDWAEDYHMWLRIAARGYRFVRPPGLLALHRERSDSMSSNRVRQLSGLRQVYLMVRDDPVFPNDAQEVAREKAALCEEGLAALTSQGLSARCGRGVRKSIGWINDTLLWRRFWYRVPPADVSSVFPDLSKL